MNTQPPDPILREILGATTRVVSKVDIYESDGVTPWMLNAPILDGSVSVDANRQDRRTFAVTMDNSDGRLSHYPGGFWYDKVLVPSRGVALTRPKTHTETVLQDFAYLYLPLGDTFSPLVELGGRNIPATAAPGYAGGMTGAWVGDPSPSALFADPLGVEIEPDVGLLEASENNFSLAFWWRTLRNDAWIAFQTSAGPAGFRVTMNKDDVAGRITFQELQSGLQYNFYAPTMSGVWQHGVVTYRPGHLRLYVNGALVQEANITLPVDREVGDTWELGRNAEDVHMQGFSFYGEELPAQRVSDHYAAGRGGGEMITDEWYAPLGKFVIDGSDADNFPRQVSVTLRDFSKKLEKSRFRVATAFAQGLALEEVVRVIAVNGGVYDYVLPATNKTLTTDFVLDPDDSRQDALQKLGESYGYDIFFDATGSLVMKNFEDPTLSPIAFAFKTGENGTLIKIKESMRDSRIFNVVTVCGESSDSTIEPVYAIAENREPSSPTSIQAIGERTLPRIVSALVTDTESALDLARLYLSVNALEEFVLSISSIVLPWIQENTIVEIHTPNPAPGAPVRYLLTDFTVPLKLGQMSANGRRVTKVG